jgi:hypothetical protein
VALRRDCQRGAGDHGETAALPVIHDFLRWLVWIALIIGAMVGLQLMAQAVQSL